MDEQSQIIGLVLVKNDDRFVYFAISNILAFCDRIIVLDNMSTDRTYEIIKSVESAHRDKLQVHRICDIKESHSYVQPYIGKNAWVLAVDGDEIYCPDSLARLRTELLCKKYDQYWRIAGPVLNVKRLKMRAQKASGYMSPPAHPMTKLYNMRAISSWIDCPQRLHGGSLVLYSEWSHSPVYAFHHHMSWDESFFRCLHMVFLRRTSSISFLRPRLSPADVLSKNKQGSSYFAKFKVSLYYIVNTLFKQSGKDNAYRKGPVVTKDISRFGLHVVDH